MKMIGVVALLLALGCAKTELVAPAAVAPMPDDEPSAAKNADDEARKRGGFAAPAPVPPAPSASGFAGNWMEYWGEGQQTDVAYHDRYLVSVNGDDASVKSVGKDQTVDGVAIVDGELRFTVHTSFEVHYALRVSPDGDLRGTATTPNKTFNIRWARPND